VVLGSKPNLLVGFPIGLRPNMKDLRGCEVGGSSNASPLLSKGSAPHARLQAPQDVTTCDAVVLNAGATKVDNPNAVYRYNSSNEVVRQFLSTARGPLVNIPNDILPLGTTEFILTAFDPV